MFSFLRGGLSSGIFGKHLTDSLKRAKGRGTEAFGDTIFGRAFNAAIEDPAANAVANKLASMTGGTPLSPSRFADVSADARDGILGAALKNAQGKAKATPMADLLKIGSSKLTGGAKVPVGHKELAKKLADSSSVFTKKKSSGLKNVIKDWGQNPIGGRAGGLPGIMGGLINI
tara:strand:+ start:105 stop:623 length:519 start_codon:yes stop_codon:yes gene_type:complete